MTSIHRMKIQLAVLCWLAILALSVVGTAQPTTVSGDPFQLVATGSGAAQLFGLTSDAQGRIYIGNNSNNTTGIPLQLFDPALYAGVPTPLASFGPPVGDADGLSYGADSIFVADRDEGVRRVNIPAGTSTVFIPDLAINGTGSPIVFRPSDGHVFVGFGATVPGAPGDNRIDEFDTAGNFVQTFTTVDEVETMTFDPDAGLIYYATFSTTVRSFDPLNGTDALVGSASGFIDGGLALDPRTGILFVGTANGPNSGLVETIDPATGITQLFATGFNGSLGILREPLSGDLYFVESNALYRLESRFIPEPSGLALLGTASLVLGTARRWRRVASASRGGCRIRGRDVVSR